MTHAQESGTTTRNLHKFLASKIWCKFTQVFGTSNLHAP